MAKYKVSKHQGIILDTVNDLAIPMDLANSDYVNYTKWLEEGNTPDPIDPEIITVPSSVAPLQARIALLKAGKLAQVEAIIAQSDETTKLAWEYATEFTRNSPIVLGLGAAIGLDSKALDQLFITASKILL
jgi:hypothetical protein